MIERLGNKVEMICDECGVSSVGPFQKADFDVMIAQAKEDGWDIYKDDIDGEWMHTCANCQE